MRIDSTDQSAGVAATRIAHVPAHAKLNLSLAVGPRDPDGYHRITSLMAPLELRDDVTLEARPAGGIALAVTGPTAARTPVDRSNLTWRAAELLAGVAVRPPDVRITLHKQIPVAGGLAGGSADAAATLLGLNELWDLGRSRRELISLAVGLGSDVPFCVAGGPAWVRGRGEVVEPLPPAADGSDPLPPLWALLIFSSLEVSTAAVYRRLDELRQSRDMRDTRKHRLAGLELFNELEVASLDTCPALRDVFERLDRSLGVPRLMVAGSGATLMAVFDSPAEAEAWRVRTVSDPNISVTVVAVGRRSART